MIYLLTKHSLGPGSDFLRRLPGLNRSDIDVMCLSWVEFGSENLEGSCCQLTFVIRSESEFLAEEEISSLQEYLKITRTMVIRCFAGWSRGCWRFAGVREY
ncbi:hypothetical protein NC652_007685 [Populus alba x Populus x berolinensis]|nr:hypothetical protein NC652_007685 [Populus alba x Populus x berolinensis]